MGTFASQNQDVLIFIYIYIYIYYAYIYYRLVSTAKRVYDLPLQNGGELGWKCNIFNHTVLSRSLVLAAKQEIDS
jgi:hypothetical protein